MINICKTKKAAKKALSANYWRSIAIVFFLSVIIGNFTLYTSNLENNLHSITSIRLPFLNSINSSIAKETIEKITNITINISSYKPERGILANIFNNVTASGSFIFGILNSFNQLIFHNRLWASLIIFLGAIITFIYWLFVRNVLLVGQARFFLENRKHKKTSFRRVLMPYKVKSTLNVGFAMMRKTLQEWLWFFTIIGIYKHYAYAFVPYILAENPKIKGKEAIKLSQNMMKGYKWKLFLFDLSLIGWYILDILSIHIVGVFFLNPYKLCCLSEIYMNIRKKAKEEKIPNIELLSDEYLEVTEDKYPTEKYIYKESASRNWLNANCEQEYSFSSLILMFFAASIFGWIWEVSLHLFQYGEFVNRGTLYGPWLHIYGWGSILLLILLKKTRKKPILTFLLSMFICGILEYTTAWYLETFKQARWWDYDGFFLNIQGRICLEGLIIFGIGGCAFIYFAASLLESIYKKIPKNLKTTLCLFLIICYVTDLAYSFQFPNTGEGVNQKLITQKNVMN